MLRGPAWLTDSIFTAPSWAKWSTPPHDATLSRIPGKALCRVLSFELTADIELVSVVQFRNFRKLGRLLIPDGKRHTYSIAAAMKRLGMTGWFHNDEIMICEPEKWLKYLRTEGDDGR